MSAEHFDVIVVGAGLSGVGAARHLQAQCPGKTYTILENRQAIGGTWDLFRYPGIRSDSDMHTLGYNFKPWQGGKVLADGTSIRHYVEETASENGITEHIRFGHKLTSAAWNSESASWTLQVQKGEGGEPVQLSCNLMLMCSGYYNYDKCYAPEFANQAAFQGTIVYPQFWPSDLDYSGKKVVVIGSGATAVTIVPAMADEVEQVTMLQRTPSYIYSRSARDWLANALRKIMPENWAYALIRWKNVMFQQRLYHMTRTRPQKVIDLVLKRARKELGDDYVAQHFTPPYNPWDQRVCLIPDNDLFDAITSGKASVVTDEIDHFTETGIALRSGQHLDADIIVSATGLEMSLMGGVAFSVDGQAVDFHQGWTYRGVMYSDVPNLVNTFGYINASWTLRADLVANFTCRLLNKMDASSSSVVTPRLREEDRNMTVRPWIDDFSSGYITRGMPLFPKQGDREPWTNPQDYLVEKTVFLKGTLDDGVLQFEEAAGKASKAA
jgi:cation diffusion facilitator CzcD-associated flavoprotein CzcO